MELKTTYTILNVNVCSGVLHFFVLRKKRLDILIGDLVELVVGNFGGTGDLKIIGAKRYG